MAHKRKEKDKKKDYVAPRTDSSHRKELRDYERKRGRIITISVSAVIIVGLITLGILLAGTPWTGSILDDDGSSIIDIGKPPKQEPKDIDVGDDDDDDDIPPYTGENPRVVIRVQGYGEIILELYPDKAPITVANFIKYAQDGFYDGLIFHRVIEDFMIQGGGFNPDMTQKNPTYPPIKNEAKTSGLKNTRGTIAMARTSDPDSATSQFFINTVDNDFLDPGADAGYAVFGEVISGIGVVDSIEKVSTHSDSGHQDVPVTDVVITSVTIE